MSKFQKSTLNQGIVAHIARHGACDFYELHSLFGEDDASHNATKRFRARLQYLVDSGQLQATGRGRGRTWYAQRHSVRALQGHTPSQPAPDTPTPWVGPVVAPRQYNVMHGPAYTPGPTLALRAGALDFRRVPSAGVRC